MADVLSQSEIDALLSALSSGDVDADEIREEAPSQVVRPFDFTRPSKFSKDQLRTLRMMHEVFCRTAQTQLSALLRAVVEIEVASADQMAYGEFINSMPTPTLINVVTMEPLEGNAVVNVDLSIVFSIIDRLVGGPGTHRPRLRELTEIELALTGGITDVLLGAFSEAWETVAPMQIRSVATEMNPQFAQVVPHSDMVVLITFEMRIGKASGTLALCVPYIVLEPVIGRLSAQSYLSTAAAVASEETRDDIAERLSVVSVPVAAELGGTELKVSDLLALSVGDVIPLAAAPGGDVTVRVGRRGAVRAQPGTRGRRAPRQIPGGWDDPERTTE
ncbi:MAG TPA: flagellar motor switch protein FliM [Miltoncostaeaceae bacterium]|nr:flagellar motor switch protein FliM [Miltoncostaeaceae bacterium]